MALVNATLTFSLPEDYHSDQLVVQEATAKDGNYNTYEALPYTYGTTSASLDIDDNRWYRLRFVNTKAGTQGPVSDPVYGGTYSTSSPFVAVSSTTDGANYATTQELYDYAGLQPQDVPTDRVSRALRHSRSIIDWRASDIGYDRQKTFRAELPDRRKRYNAALRIIKEAEICLALGSLYDAMSDTKIIQSLREGEEGPQDGMAAIGGTSTNISTLAERSDSILYLSALSDKYTQRGEALLQSLDPTSVALVSYDTYVRSPRFKYPFHGWPR